MPYQKSAQTALPFVDAHVHVRTPEGFVSAATAGIAAIRDAGLRANAGEKLFRTPSVPLVVSSGWALYSKGGYGEAFGIATASRDEIRHEIKRLSQAGAGIIKIMASGMVSLKKPGTITQGGFSPEDIAYIVQEAKTFDLPVMAHANGEDAIMAAAGAGVRSIEHGFFMTNRALDHMMRHDVAWVPTVTALARVATADTSAELGRFVQGLILSHQKMILSAHSLGVALAIGTDCVLPYAAYRACYDAELDSFGEAGLLRVDVLDIATRGGAQLLGISLENVVL